jgi:tetratricopeptide (TPR) repeat protein
MPKLSTDTDTDELLRLCTVELTTTKNDRGTGFFVAPGKIITCAHVVNKTQANEIKIRWGEHNITASNLSLPKDENIDLVILDILIGETDCYPCVYLGAEANSYDKLYSYGYPTPAHDGDSMGCTCTGLSDAGRILTLTGHDIRPGFSGAPLLNKNTKKVCGIVIQERQAVEAKIGGEMILRATGGLAIPTEVIFAQYPELEKQQQEFHNNDTRWSQFFSDTPVCLPSNTPYKKFLYSLPEVVDHFQDRHDGVEWIRYFLNHPERVMFLIGREGIGKTQMVSHAIKLLTDINELSENATSDKKEKLNVVNVGYCTLARETLIVSRIFSELCGLLPDNRAEELKAFCRDSKIEIRCKVDKLLSEFSVAQTLVIIDDFDKVLNAENQEIQDQNRELEEILCALQDYPYPHSVKVIIISGYTPRQSAILSLENTTVKWLCGLDSPYGEQYLRDLDQDGKLAKYSDEELRAICERIHGFPIAICALHKTLQLNIVASLKDILNDLDNLVSSNEYRGIIEALIGRVFKSLSSSEKQVMQILAVYKHPTLLVAVDYVAKQCQPDINTKAILNSLGDKQLVNVNRDNKEEAFYFLHSIDAEYALSQIKSSNNSLFTEVNLLHHAANYWTATRESLEKSLDSLNHESLVQHAELALAEFDLRYKAEEYGEAATALFSIEVSLSQLGQYGVIRRQCELIQDKINDLLLKVKIAILLGTVYLNSGQYKLAIDSYESGLKTAQKINNQAFEGICLSNLGNCYYGLGDFDVAIKKHEEALKIARDSQSLEFEAGQLNNIGICYRSLEQIDEAIRCYLDGIARKPGNPELEGVLYNNLGICYKERGRVEDMAIGFHKKALAIARLTQNFELGLQCYCGLGNCYTTLGQFDRAIKRYEKALVLSEGMKDQTAQGQGSIDFPIRGTTLHSLAEVLIDSEQYEKAIKYAKDGLKIGKDINSPKLKIENGCALARCYLYQNNLSLAYAQAMKAKTNEIPEYKYYALGLLGLISLRQGDHQLAYKSFREALAEIENVLDKNARNYTALDIKGLSLTALALFSDEKYFEKAKEAYKKARRISSHAGTVLRALRLLHELEIITSGEKLSEIKVIMTQLDKNQS